MELWLTAGSAQSHGEMICFLGFLSQAIEDLAKFRVWFAKENNMGYDLYIFGITNVVYFAKIFVRVWCIEYSTVSLGL